jgi:hypothetical protein
MVLINLLVIEVRRRLMLLLMLSVAVGIQFSGIEQLGDGL